jgi:hypothetical protein
MGGYLPPYFSANLSSAQEAAPAEGARQVSFRPPVAAFRSLQGMYFTEFLTVWIMQSWASVPGDTALTAPGNQASPSAAAVRRQMLYKKLKADGKAALEAGNMVFIMAKGMEAAAG